MISINFLRFRLCFILLFEVKALNRRIFNVCLAIFQHYEWKDFGQIVGQKSNPIYKFWRLESAHHLMLLWPISVKINHFINEKFLGILQERRTFFHCTWTFSRILIWANFNSRKKKENSIFFQKMTFSLT